MNLKNNISCHNKRVGENIENMLKVYESISLEEMDSVKLMNRIDSKYIFNISHMREILERLRGYYRVLEVNGYRLCKYKTLYYDTPKLTLFLQHHNGKKNRFKIRCRQYLSSEITFLEVKKKNNKGRTIKERISVESFKEAITKDDVTFINNEMAFHDSLYPVLLNEFERITLVSNNLKERLTLDLGLTFSKYRNGGVREFEDLVIAEVKQEKLDRQSPFISLMKDMYIRPQRISKYCIGTSLLNSSVKSNVFKEKIRSINKIVQNSI